MAGSRVDKYKELREGIKEEAGIKHDDVKEDTSHVDEKDDFFSFVNRDNNEEEVNLDDTLAEAITLDQMDSNSEIDRALRSAKSKVGKDEKYNTRMDILTKIREPQTSKIKIDSYDEYNTDSFSTGMILNQEEPEEETEEVQEEVTPKPKMTLMERLAAMSPKEDVEKAKEVLKEEIPEEVEEETKEEPENIDEEEVAFEQAVEEEVEEETEEITQQDLNDMLLKIKEKDAQIVKETTGQEIDVTKTFEAVRNDEEELVEYSKAAKVLNYIIVVLIIILILLFLVIAYQSLF